jgi:hypothetical protein
MQRINLDWLYDSAQVHDIQTPSLVQYMWVIFDPESLHEAYC